MHCLVVLAWLTGCGRIGFDPEGRDAAPAIDATLADASRVPIAFVQTAANSAGGATTVSATFVSPVGPGHTLVVGLDFDHGGQVPSLTLDDDLQDTYTVLDARDAFSSFMQFIAIAPVAGSGIATVTATLDLPAANFIELRVLDYTGLAETNLGDGATGTEGTAATAPTDVTAPAVVTTAPNELLLGLTVCDCGSTSGPGMTQRSNFDADTFEELLAPTPGSHTLVTTLQQPGRWRFSVVALRGQ